MFFYPLVPGPGLDGVHVQFDSQARSGGEVQLTLGILQWLLKQLFTEEQWAEKLCSEVDSGLGAREVQRSGGADRAFDGRRTVARDTGGLGNPAGGGAGA